MNTTLRSSETILALSLVLLITSLVAIAKYNASESRCPREMEALPENVPYDVHILGAVSRPGAYKIMPGTTYRVAIQKAKPKRFADFKSVDLNKRVEGPTEIFIGELKELAVYVREGEGEPIRVSMEPGARVVDLKGRFPQKKSALKSRRMLKDGEILDLRKERD